ncbi:MAG: AAA domain-containing protein [Verrucomicrobiota bacterium]
MSRPYISSSIEDLEAIYLANRNDTGILHKLLDELKRRSTKRSTQLRMNVETALAVAVSPSSQSVNPEFEFGEPVAPPQPPQAKSSTQGNPPPAVKVHPPERSPSGLPPKPITKHRWADAEPIAFPAVSNKPTEILNAWSAIEILSPPTFDRPQSLAGGDPSRVAKLNEPLLPWERGERSRPNQRLYYQIVLGSIELEPAIDALVERFGDSRAERPPARGNAIVAVVVVDKSGKLVEAPAVGVSSFGWGLMTALTGDLADLAGWTEVEKHLVELVEKALAPPEADEDDEWRDKPLTRESIERASQALVVSFGIPLEWVTRPEFAIRSFVYFKDPNPPEPLLLNSFFLSDLAAAKHLFSKGEATHNLKAYLGAWVPPGRKNILEDTTALDASLAPLSTPLARWPSKDRSSLALLQQSAVNLAFGKTTPEGVLGVNGPPGTGKTTLLRDVVANVVVERASALAAFDDPEQAFEYSGEKFMASGSWLHLYKLNSALRGFEMIVASSNNRAVENVSAELPDLKAIATDAPHLRYFKTLSDSIHDRDTWGAIAAVLGNAQNRAKFKQQFWWDDDFGLNNYLRAAAGSRQKIEFENPDTQKMELRLPVIVEREDPPESHKDALVRWAAARRHFKKVKEKSLSWFTWLESLRADVNKLPDLKSQKQASLNAEYHAAENEKQTRDILGRLQTHLRAIEGELSKLEMKELELSNLRISVTQADAKLAHAEASLRTHGNSKPGSIRQFFDRQSLLQWQIRQEQLQSVLSQAYQINASVVAKLRGMEVANSLDMKRLAELRLQHRVVLSNSQAAERNQQDAVNSLRSAKHRAQEAAGTLEKVAERLSEARVKHGVTLLDQAFWSSGHESLQTSAAWFPKEAQRARDELFIAAIQLHKAFIDAAAKPLRNNLGVLMNIFSSQSLPNAAKQSLLGDLWSTLFLVVPLVSTTFASVQRMLGRLPLNALGWLLIDEAGQAVPQAAIGAIMRAKRIVVLGDPIQIEPVVTLPDVLTQSILRRFGADPDRFGAPLASVQTLADAASPVMAEFPTKHGTRHVGAPLLVHRRCSSPMFEIANNIAYAGLMVSQKQPEVSPIMNCLGPSSWIHVTGSGEDKWCDAEGRVVLSMLEKLRHGGIKPDIYVVSPFVIVAERLRQLILNSKVLQGWIEDDEWLWVNSRVGTVHTAQGRESDAVIFVLGAPNSAQSGARNWAGGRPNLLNVAVTRAKEALYVVGNRQLWREAGVFSQLDLQLP